MKIFALIAMIIFCFPVIITALPIDWHGTFGLDTTTIKDYRPRDKADVDPGSQRVPEASGGKSNASFQTYIFKLNPTIIINDSASFFAEISSGYARGGRLGDDDRRSFNKGDFAQSLYVHNVPSGDNTLAVTKMYAKYYADTATYILGRHGYHWGLGAVYNGGDRVWDRHFTVRDGFTLEIKLGNFYITPHWAKIRNSFLTDATHMREYGMGLLYNNHERDLAFGLQYGKKENPSKQIFANNDDTEDTTYSLGTTNVKITDLYLKKSLGDWSFAIEVPIFSGRIGGFTKDSTKKEKAGSDKEKAGSYTARALLFKGRYKLSNFWDLFLEAGEVDGDSGNPSDFKAMYLHPNYQIANLLFRYNFRAVSRPDNVNVFDSYITNASFLKIGATYTGQRWDTHFSAIMAQAKQTASKGQNAFNHATSRTYKAKADQDDSLGMEIDVNFHYKWNKEVSVGILTGYLFTGDYYAFTNNPNNPAKVSNSFILQLNTAIDF